jgi:hypothetical protein
MGRYEIALNLATVEKWLTDNDDPSLLTELRHELAHISNRDIDLTYLAIAAWRTFIIAITLPYIAVAATAPQRLPDLSIRLAGLLLLVWLVRRAVLRTREFYADVRAADSPANEAAVRTYLHLPSSHATRWEPLSTHPTRANRIVAIDDGRPMFGLSLWVAGATGGLVGIAYTPTAYLLALLFPGQDHLRSWIGGTLFGILVAGVLTGSTWRYALAHLSEGRRWSSTLPAAAAFTAALLLGQCAMPELPDGPTWLDVLRTSPINAALVALALLAAIQTYLRWTMYCAIVWLPVAQHPRRTYHLGVAQSAIVIGLWLGAWFHLVELLRAGGSYTVLALMLVWVTLNPPLLLALVWACAFPLAAWRTRRPDVDTPPRWWRAGDDTTAKRLPESRPPLASAYLATAGTVLLYSALILPDYPAIAATVNIIHTEMPPPPIAYIQLVWLLTQPLAYSTAVVGLAIGLLLGGRRATNRAVTCAGLTALPASIALMTTILVHLTTAGSGLRDLGTLFKGLSGIGALAPDDQAENPALGLMLLCLMALLFVILVTTAALGSTVRAALPRTARQRPARSTGRVAAWSAPLVVAALIVGYLGWTNWTAAASARIEQTIDAATVEPVIAQARPGTMTPLASCVAIFQAHGDGAELASDVAAANLDRYLATVAMLAISSTDSTIQAIGEGTVESLRGKQLGSAAAGVTVTIRYCLASTDLTGPKETAH